MKIGIDFDDVITEFTGSLMSYYHEKYGKKVSKEEILVWDWGLYWGIPREEAIKRGDIFHDTYDVKNILPLEKAIYSLNELMKEHEIFIITARPSRFKHRVEEWLKHHLGKKLEVIHAGDFHKGQGASKAEICKELSIGVLLEDSGETATDCANNGINVILFDKPWNKNIEHDNIVRVNNWDEALRELEKHENKNS